MVIDIILNATFLPLKWLIMLNHFLLLALALTSILVNAQTAVTNHGALHVKVIQLPDANNNARCTTWNEFWLAYFGQDFTMQMRCIGWRKTGVAM
jgi:hypothetical protein